MNAESHDAPMAAVELAHQQAAVVGEIIIDVINIPALIFPFLGVLVKGHTRTSASEAIMGAHGGGH